MRRHEPQPGDIGLSRITGFTGLFVSFGQWLIGDASRYTHAFIVVDGGRVVEAMPGGATYGSLQHYLDTGAVFSSGKIHLTDEQRALIVDEANSLIGTPYSFLDYAAIGLHRLGLRPRFIEKYVSSSAHMICSQLVDYVYCLAGIHLFFDARLSQNVTPGDIANVLIEEW